MKCWWSSFFIGAIFFLLSDCTYNDLVSGEKVSTSSIDYLMFGHTAGFCMKCDEIYKIEEGELFGANHQMISDPDVVQLALLPVSAYDLVSALTSQIPKRIVTGSTSSINNIGTYFPDAGHTYIEVSQNKKIYRWYIEPGNLPNDLKDFVTAVNEAMGKLN